MQKISHFLNEGIRAHIIEGSEGIGLMVEIGVWINNLLQDILYIRHLLGNVGTI